MRATAPYAVIGLGVIIMAGIAWWFGFRNTEAPVPEPAPEAPAIQLSEGLSIYTNGEHGFLLAYPEGAEVAESFEHERLPDMWSLSAEGQGTPLLSITTYRVENDSSYPRDYTVLLRIGKSEDAGDRRSCLVARNGETELTARTIGDIAWSAFAYGDAGMMRYVEAVSYRAEHEGACWALEAIRLGSNYREEASDADMPDEVLRAEYDRLIPVVDSFRFAR